MAKKKIQSEVPSYDEFFDYYRLQIKLKTEMLGTCTEADIYHEHVLKKAQKLIKKANVIGGKLTKKLKKYEGKEISLEKEVKEIQGIVRHYGEILGKTDKLPNTIEGLMEYNDSIQEELEDFFLNKEMNQGITIFMKDEDGWPMISTHMILGNIKGNLSTIINNTPKGSYGVTSKVAVSEIGALDVSPIEEFVRPSLDIKREKNGEHKLLERIVRFNRMGKDETAIQRSESIPAGARFEVHLRVRKLSPFNLDGAKLLREVLAYGLNQGLGAWRGSGNKGQYIYRLTQVTAQEAESLEWED